MVFGSHLYIIYLNWTILITLYLFLFQLNTKKSKNHKPLLHCYSLKIHVDDTTATNSANVVTKFGRKRVLELTEMSPKKDTEETFCEVCERFLIISMRRIYFIYMFNVTLSM